MSVNLCCNIQSNIYLNLKSTIYNNPILLHPRMVQNAIQKPTFCSSQTRFRISIRIPHFCSSQVRFRISTTQKYNYTQVSCKKLYPKILLYLSMVAFREEYAQVSVASLYSTNTLVFTLKRATLHPQLWWQMFIPWCKLAIFSANTFVFTLQELVAGT